MCTGMPPLTHACSQLVHGAAASWACRYILKAGTEEGEAGAGASTSVTDKLQVWTACRAAGCVSAAAVLLLSLVMMAVWCKDSSRLQDLHALTANLGACQAPPCIWYIKPLAPNAVCMACLHAVCAARAQDGR